MSTPPPPMTEDQFDLIEYHTAHAVRKAIRHSRNQALAGFMILVVGIGGALYATDHDADVARDAIITSGSVVAVDSCNGRFADRVALRAVFTRLQDAVRSQAKREHRSPDSEQVQYALKFYRDEKARLPLPDCRPVAKILTDQPFPPRKIPAPRHP